MIKRVADMLAPAKGTPYIFMPFHTVGVGGAGALIVSTMFSGYCRELKVSAPDSS
ncbi:hypothetical protein D3C76_1518600 [compost metagenome]